MMGGRDISARLMRRLREALESGRRIGREEAVSLIETETGEMETVFALLVLGFFVGLPAPPMQISLEVMPLMEEELISLIEGVDTAHEPISHLFSTFDIG